MMYQGTLLSADTVSEIKVSAFFHAKFLSLHYVDGENIREINWLYPEIRVSEETDFASILHEPTGMQLQVIENRESFYKSISEYKSGKQSWWRSFHEWKYKGLFLVYSIIFTIILLGVLSYFFFVPFLAENIANQIPIKYEVEMGDKIYAQTIESSKIDQNKTILLNEFYKELHQKTPYPIHITCVKDDVVNAFALPGGNIIIYEGILDKLNRTESLAALLGHEATHITERHATRSLLKSIGGYMIVSLLLGDFTGVVAVVADNAQAISNLSYSRELEMDADNHSIALLLEQRIDINGMVSLFEVLQKEEKNQSETLSFLSTHPLTKDRLQNAKTAKGLQKNAIPHLALDTLFKKIKDQ